MMKDCFDISDCRRASDPFHSANPGDFRRNAGADEHITDPSRKNIPWIDIYFVMSMDGIVAMDHEHDIRNYSSTEDREFFLNSIKNYDGIIVSSRTFVKDASPGTKRVILTHSKPAEDDPDPDNIYMSGDERMICEKMWDLGLRKAALAGGPTTCLSFIRAGLVKDLYLSIEPVTLGHGIRLFTEEKFISRWTLIESRQLNERGTVMIHYRNTGSDSDT